MYNDEQGDAEYYANQEADAKAQYEAECDAQGRAEAECAAQEAEAEQNKPTSPASEQECTCLPMLHKYCPIHSADIPASEPIEKLEITAIGQSMGEQAVRITINKIIDHLNTTRGKKE
jgi:hypothetical protein